MSKQGKSSAKKATKERLVSAEYGRQLKAVIDANGGLTNLAREASMSLPTAWRVTEGTGTVDAAEKLLAALKGRGVDFPPPVIRAPHAELEEWISLGSELLELDRDRFESTVTKVRDVVQALRLLKSGSDL
jgi:hypothetical protein